MVWEHLYGAACPRGCGWQCWVCLCRRGVLGTPRLLQWSAVIAQMLLQGPRAGSRNFSFNLASKFGGLGREGSGFCWKGRS